MTIEVVGDAASAPDARVDALRLLVDSGLEVPPLTVESNNHIHTIYSFSPYTPAMACLRGREAGLQVVGSVDHDSLAAAGEMRDAGTVLGLGVVTGFELRVMLHSADEVAGGRAPFADRKLNNPDSPGVAYITVQGIPAAARREVEGFLGPIRAARLERTRRMTDAVNDILSGIGARTLDFETDVVGISQFASGGTITERHLLYAMSEALIDRFGRGDSLTAGLAELGVDVPESLHGLLTDRQNPFLAHDLLGLLKSQYLDRFYIQPTRLNDGGELPDARGVVEFALSIGAIPCYAYLGDVSSSPTGDKKAEAFEDSYLDDLVEHLASLGFPAITFMPPRNSAQQLVRISALASEHGMIQVSGVDINQPRQVFSCPELAEARFAHLNDSTWALVAHEELSSSDPTRGLLHPDNPLAGLPLGERIIRYGELGRQIVAERSTATTRGGS